MCPIAARASGSWRSIFRPSETARLPGPTTSKTGSVPWGSCALSNREPTWFCTSRSDPTKQAERRAPPSPSIRMRIEAMTRHNRRRSGRALRRRRSQAKLFALRLARWVASGGWPLIEQACGASARRSLPPQPPLAVRVAADPPRSLKAPGVVAAKALLDSLK